MERTLAEFIRAYEEKPWDPGIVDCCLFLAAWAIWLGYNDPAWHLRCRYWDEKGFGKIIDEYNGLVPLVDGCVDIIAGQRVQSPICGDIGIIGSRWLVRRQYGAIYDGERWQVRAIKGVTPMIANPLAIWRI